MARRRLTPPDMVAEDAIPAGAETKSIFPMGVARTVSRPPIAQVAGEASALSALEEMASEITRARAEGRIVQRLALDDIDADHLVRDRMAVDDEETAVLVASIRARGQQTPVEVLDRGEGVRPRYGLISGWRRIAALRETGAENALAIVRAPATAAEAYVAMVEENEIRADISFYERARIVAKALEAGVFSEPKEALQSLFGNVSRAKRSKIKSFMTIVAALDGALHFPAAISERAGLDLVKRLEADPGLSARLIARLSAAAPQTAEAELAILMAAERPAPSADRPEAEPRESAAFEIEFDPAAHTVRVSGLTVDARFVRDLERWLARR